MAGFNLSNKKSTSKPVVDEFCVQQSKKLRDFVKQMRWSPISRTPKKWSDSVRLLRNDLDPDGRAGEYEISTVLDKYLSLSQSIGFAPEKTGGFPKCKDMAQFRRCWDWINNVIFKHERDNPTVVVTDHAKAIVVVLRRKSWPGNCLSKLEQAVQVSLDNFDTFIEKLKREWKLSNNELWKFYKYVLDKIPSDTQFVLEWFEEVHKRVGEWEDWNGNIMLEVFKPESKQFRKWGRNVARQWSGKTELWDKLEERLGISNGKESK